LGWKCLVILWQFEIYLDIFISICYFCGHFGLLYQENLATLHSATQVRTQKVPTPLHSGHFYLEVRYSI
jgi:hypothetical protein